ncbi:uncharacterized protein LOC134453286 [Engraulis encrasicolus]|uniref:uncharacterized protein LOC134453286 n=1 Tax=Engraulis encrasicolus TaxID=184585 RepID=UPI002FD311A2
MAPTHSLTSSMALSNTQQTFMNAVIPSLKTGLTSLNDLAAKVIEAKVPHILRSGAKYADIRTSIVETQKHFGQSERAASSGLNSINAEYEVLTVRKGELESEIAAKEVERNNIGMQKQQATQSLRSAEQSLQASKREYAHALWRLRTAERKMGDGWTAGGVSISSALEDYGNARYMANKAEDEMKTSDDAVKHYSNQISQYTTRYIDLDSNIRLLDLEMLRFDFAIVKIGFQQDAAAQIQSKLSEATSVLGDLARASDAAEIETRTYIAVGALIHTVQDIFELSERYGLEFENQGVESLIGSLQKYEDEL